MASDGKFKSGIFLGGGRFEERNDYGMKWPLLVRCSIKLNREQIEREGWECQLVNQNRDEIELAEVHTAIRDDDRTSDGHRIFAKAWVLVTGFFLAADSKGVISDGVMLSVSADPVAVELLGFDPRESGRYWLWRSIDTFISEEFRDAIAYELASREARKLEDAKDPASM